MDPYEKTRQLVQILLKGQSETTPATIRAAIERVLPVLDGQDGTAIDVEKLAKDLETRFNVWVGQETVLQDVRGHEPWLPDRRGQIGWRFWKRYERYLEEDEGWPPQSVTRVGQLTDSILEKLEAPDRPGSWDRRGMVVGNVQSGKTSNYIAFICKAVDAGYKLIIVLAGMHKNLRSQTQLRTSPALNFKRCCSRLRSIAPSRCPSYGSFWTGWYWAWPSPAYWSSRHGG